jgi:DNA-binding PadR family transcriptional regulator
VNTASTSGDTSKLTVLGLLSMGPNHGYGLRAILESWEVHRWLDVKYGSIYAALHRFADAGLVEVAEVAADRGPNRTTYRLTEAGRAELCELARRAWTQTPQWSMPIDMAVMFLTFDWVGNGILDRNEVAKLLRARVTALDASIARLTATKNDLLGLTEFEPLRALQRAHFDHGLQLLDAERTWTTSTLEALEAGAFDLRY